MTDSNENNKTLKLNTTAKPVLSPAAEAGNLDTTKMNYMGSRGKSRTVTVEVKKTKGSVKERYKEAEALFKPVKKDIENISESILDPSKLTEGERQARLEALKKANEKMQIEKENKNKIQENAIEDSVVVEKSSDRSPLHLEAMESKNPTSSQEEIIIKSENTEISNSVSGLQPVMVEENKVISLDEEEDEKNKKSHKNEKKLGTKNVREEKRHNKYSLNELIESDNIEDIQDVEEIELEETPKAFVKRNFKPKKFKNSVKREKVIREVIIPDTITVQELSSRMAERAVDVIKELMKLGVMANINYVIDTDTAELIVGSFGHIAKRVSEFDIEKDFNIRMSKELNQNNLVFRAPIITVMGHVDHGKTSLLDALRSSNVTKSEAGGITQHIGAYKILTKSGKEIVFLDTPGHEAFTAIRSRGAKCTDIVILLVAADDGIMPQTIEAINHAKAADVAIIVAINKIDKPNANVAKIKSDLLSYNVVLEEFGGNVLSVEISAKEKIGLEELEETILMQAELLELKANPNREASGTVLEAKIDKGRGIIANILVQNGTLNIGDLVIMGTSFGKVRKLIDDKGKFLKSVGPSTPVEVLGLNSIAEAGTNFVVINDEKKAREITDFREHKNKESKYLNNKRSNMQEFLASSKKEVKELSLIIKTDSQGSKEAINISLEKAFHEELRVKVVHSAIGTITESDVNLAQVSNAVILGFNVTAESKVRLLAEKNKITIKHYSIIYNLLDEVKSLLGGMLTPILREVYLGSAECRQVFDITKYGKIAGSYVIKGLIKRGGFVKLMRNKEVIFEGLLRTLKRMKDDVKEVKEGYECGIGIENYNDIKVGDIIEVFERIEEKRELL